MGFGFWPEIPMDVTQFCRISRGDASTNQVLNPTPCSDVFWNSPKEIPFWNLLTIETSNSKQSVESLHS